MIYGKEIVGEKTILRDLAPADCTDRYLNWLTDPDINRFLESRLTEQTIQSIRNFVIDIAGSKNNYMFAIIYKDTEEHIGNIKVGPIHPHYKNAYIGYLIGEQRYWGRGIATEAISLTAGFCFDHLGLHKVSAGLIEPNIASRRALEKAGFKPEGLFRQEVAVDGQYVNTMRYGLLHEDFEAQKAKK